MLRPVSGLQSYRKSCAPRSSYLLIRPKKSPAAMRAQPGFG